jgi:hypothetical protein
MAVLAVTVEIKVQAALLQKLDIAAVEGKPVELP